MSEIVVPTFADVRRHGDLLVFAGQAAFDPAKGEVVGADLPAQFAFTIARIETLLEEHGAGLADVLRVECFLSRREDFGTWNALYEEAFPEPRPARTTLVSELVIPELLIELQIIAGAPAAI